MAQRIQTPWTDQEAQQLQEALQSGAILAFPTETSYGLGGNAFLESVNQKVAAIKQRPAHKPFPLLIQPFLLSQMTLPSTPQVEALMQRFWPGALTLILPIAPHAPVCLHNDTQSLAVRHSSCEVVEQLISLGQCPLVGTSANLSGTPALNNAQDVEEQLGDQIDFIIDGGPTPGGAPSSLLNVTQTPFTLEREGVLDSVLRDVL